MTARGGSAYDTLEMMKISKPKSKAISIIACLLALPAIGVLLTLPHWCFPVSTAEITYNGKPSLGSRLYRISNGELLLKVQNQKDRTYLIAPKSKKVYSPNGTNLLPFLGAVFIVHLDQGGVDLEYTAKTDLHPNIVAGTNFIEFTGFSGGRIRAAW